MAYQSTTDCGDTYEHLISKYQTSKSCDLQRQGLKIKKQMQAQGNSQSVADLHNKQVLNPPVLKKGSVRRVPTAKDFVNSQSSKLLIPQSVA